MIRTTKEWINSEHARGSGLINKDGTPGPLIWLNRGLKTKCTLTNGPISNREPYLKGIKVLDLCNVIAGPKICGILARYGAEVIKLDPEKPMYDPIISIIIRFIIW